MDPATRMTLKPLSRNTLSVCCRFVVDCGYVAQQIEIARYKFLTVTAVHPPLVSWGVYTIQQTSSKLPANLFKIHVNCWTFAGSCKHPHQTRSCAVDRSAASDLVTAPRRKLVMSDTFGDKVTRTITTARERQSERETEQYIKSRRQ